MTHEDAGHYAAKHPGERRPDPKVQEAVQNAAKDGKITCVASHRTAEQCGVSPGEVGFTVDFNEFRLTRCQLGLFGYYPEKRLVKPAPEVSADLEQAIRASLNEKGKLTCIKAWEIAGNMGIKKIDVSAACETLEIRITSCQLGAFK